MDIETIKTLLKQYNLRPNFTYGQNFLLDEDVLSDIVSAAEVTAEDVVVEIGPGIGNLTRLLCQRAKFVLSVEKDPKFQPVLYAVKKDFRKNFRYEIADILEFNLESFFADNLKLTTYNFKLIANIPYYITGKILQMFLSASRKPKEIVVLTQKEVAQNIVAGPGKLSLLAISVQLFGRPEIVRLVPRSSFYPAPKVDSAILKISLFDEPKFKIADEKFFFKVVKACFAGKRKQLHNTLVNNLRLNKEDVAKVLLALKISPSARPQELTIEQWAKLAEKIKA